MGSENNRTEGEGIRSVIPEPVTGEDSLLSLSDAKDLLDILYLVNALLRDGGNLTRAAEELGVGRRTVYDLMDKCGISCAEGILTLKLSPATRYMELRAPCIEEYLK